MGHGKNARRSIGCILCRVNILQFLSRRTFHAGLRDFEYMLRQMRPRVVPKWIQRVDITDVVLEEFVPAADEKSGVWPIDRSSGARREPEDRRALPP